MTSDTERHLAIDPDAPATADEQRAAAALAAALEGRREQVAGPTAELETAAFLRSVGAARLSDEAAERVLARVASRRGLGRVAGVGGATLALAAAALLAYMALREPVSSRRSFGEAPRPTLALLRAQAAYVEGDDPDALRRALGPYRRELYTALRSRYALPSRPSEQTGSPR